MLTLYGVSRSRATRPLWALLETGLEHTQVPVLQAYRLTGANADVLVAVQGQVQAGAQVLNATRVQCAGVSGSDSETVERSGVVTQVNLQTRTLTLLTAKGSVAIVWDAQTYFSMGFLQHPESLLGQSVEVEGVNQTGILRARKIKASGASHMPG